MINRENYKAMKRYLIYQTEVLQADPETVKRKEVRLKHALRWADEQSFEQAYGIRPVFPRYLQTVHRGDQMVAGQHVALSAVGVRRICGDVRLFFEWLVMMWPKRYPLITPAWISTIQPTKMASEPRREHEAVTLDMVRQLLRVEANDLVTRREKAAAAFLFLSGARSSAFCSLSQETVDIDRRLVLQYPTMGVRTKNMKAVRTTLLNIPDLLAEVRAWDAFVRARLPPSTPWYAVIRIVNGEQVLTAEAPGVHRRAVLNRRIKRLFEQAGLVPMPPHKFRHGHAVYSLMLSQDVSDLKAVSQNLGHSNIGVTDSIYAVLSDAGVAERITRLSENGKQKSVDESLVAEIVREVMARVG